MLRSAAASKIAEMSTDHDSLFEAAYAAFDAGDLDEAQRLAKRGVDACRRARAPEAHAAPGLYVLAAVELERLDDDAAWAALAKLRAAAPDFADGLLLEARLRTSRWEFAAAERLLEQVDADEPAALYQRAVLAELQGRDAEAEECYAAAAAADAEAFPLPVRISDDEVHALLREVIESLPEPVVATMRNLSVDLLPVPDPRLHADVDPELLGLYAGAPIGEADAMPMALPDRIYIFKRNIERVASDREELLEQLRITLLHELGHHLGLDEDDLAERGLD